jgi:hypothetical protein
VSSLRFENNDLIDAEPSLIPKKSSKPRTIYWNKQRQKEFFDQLAIKWNIQKLEDWNKVTTRMIFKEGGHFIKIYYKSSILQGKNSTYILTICQALQAIYPDYIPTSKPYGYWKDKENQKKFFDQLAIKWNIQKPEDWNKVTKEMVMKEGGSFITSIRQSKHCRLYWISMSTL